jgi:hypothetical protein
MNKATEEVSICLSCETWQVADTEPHLDHLDLDFLRLQSKTQDWEQEKKQILSVKIYPIQGTLNAKFWNMSSI